MKQSLRTWAALAVLVAAKLSSVPTAQAEGSKQLTPNNANTPTDLTQPTNTRAGFLTHNAEVALGFLKPASWGTTALPFADDYRMFVRLKPGETLNYGVHRSSFGTSPYADLTLTLRFGTGDGTIVKQNTLARDAGSTNQATLLTNQAGVIDDAAQALAGPSTLAGASGYQPLTYTNTTGSTQDFFVEFTQAGEFTDTGTQSGFNDLKTKAVPTATQLRSEYDYWDLTVVGTDNLEKPGRLFSRFWAFTAGTSTGAVDEFRNRLSDTFKLFPLVESKQSPGQFYVKEVELAGMRPLVFFYVTNEFGSNQIGTATDFATRRKSQTSNTAYAQYPNFVNDPDPTIWPSAPIPTVSVTPQPFCRNGNTEVAFTTNSAEDGQFDILIDLNGVAGYQPNTDDVLLFQPITAGVSSTVVWNGLTRGGARVTSNRQVNFQFTSNGAAFNFPVFDAEGNPDGFRVRNVRPASGNTFDRLYWDDSNLDVTRFPDPRVEQAGQVSTNGVHRWGATNNDGNLYLVNTYTFGFSAFTSAQSFTYTSACDNDGDGVADNVDIDDDNDGILDVVEAFGANPSSFRTSTSAAANATIAIAYLDAGFVHPVFGAFLDTNNDGVSDYFDTDRDGVPNHFDLDADGDGIPDAVEANGNVVPTFTSGPETLTYGNKNSPTVFIYHSLYSVAESRYVSTAAATSSAAGASAGVSANGLPDAVETSVVHSEGGNNNNPVVISTESGVSKYTLADSDLDSFAANGTTARNYNFLDIDSDNDGITDEIEFQNTTAYNTRKAQANFNTDSDKNGLRDAYDPGNGGTSIGTAVNSGGSALADMFDIDSDGDNAGKSGLPIYRQTADWSEGFDVNSSGFSGDEILTKARQFAINNPGKANYYPVTSAPNGNASTLSLFLQDANANGIPNFLEPGNTYYRDDNFNGLVDIYDPAYGGAPSTAPKRTAAQPDADFRNAAVGTPLPVTLLDFQAQATGNDVVLNWATAQELNNAGFDIERSADGNTFTKVDFVTGQGTTSQRTNYVATDKGAGLRGTTWFYRLRQVDRDGTASFSPVRMVSFTGAKGPAQLLAYPNPAHSAIRVMVLGTAPTGSLQVFDAVGRLVHSQLAPVAGTEAVLPLTGLPAGIYVLRCGTLSKRITVE